jgi:hypothetical protein
MDGNFRCSSTWSYAGRWAAFCTYGNGKCAILGKDILRQKYVGEIQMCQQQALRTVLV